jgi:aminopeptidase 2
MSTSTSPTGQPLTVRSADPNNLRLPDFVKPVAYRLEIEPDFVEKRVYGVAEIDLEFSAVTQDILLHASDLNVTLATLRRGSDKQETKHVGPPKQFAGDQQYVLLQFPSLQSALMEQRSDRFTLRLQFTALLRNDMSGFYLSTYKDGKGNTQQLAATQFESESARAAFPCFDEPSFKATYDIGLRVDVAKFPTVLSNMPEASREPVTRSLNGAADGPVALTRVKFQTTPPMSSYLVAFVVADLARYVAPNSTAPRDDSERDQAGSPPRVAISVYSTHETINQTHYAGLIARQALAQFESIFKVDYPLPKMDLVAIPDFSAGAMENWGLITFRTVALLYDVHHTTAREKESIALTVVHEIAHQWFGNIVTMEWWDELWLNEGFATFMSYLCTNEIYKSQTSEIDDKGWVLWESFAGVQRIAMAIDSLAHTHAIRQPVERPSDVDLLFDGITYDKGGSLLRMLYKSNLMNPGNFELGITRYLNDHKYANAHSSELFGRWAMVSSEPDLAALLEPWIALPGFPVVSFRRVEADRYVAVQQRYSEEPGFVASNDTATSTWWVPLSIQNDDTETVINLRPGQRESAPLDVSRLYFVANADRWGLYRVAYAPEMLASITDHIMLRGIAAPYSQPDQNVAAKDRPITPLDYAGTLDDLRSFSITGFNNVTAADVLNFGQHVNKTTSFLCWSTGLQAFGDFYRLLVVGNYTVLAERMGGFILAVADKLVTEALPPVPGAPPKPTSNVTVDHMLEKLYERVMPLAVRLNHTGAVEAMKACWQAASGGGKCGADGLLRAGPGFIAPQLQSAAFTYAAMYNASAFDELWQRFQTTEFPGESRRLLAALVLVQDPTRRTQLLNMALPGGQVRPQDRDSVLVGVAGASNEGRVAAWNFVQDNFGRLGGGTAIFGGASRPVAGIGSMFATEADLAAFRQFVVQHKEHGLDGRNIEQAIEQVQHSINWLKRNVPSIQAFFKI